MRHAIWMLGLSLALSGLAAGADESSPIPRPEAEVAAFGTRATPLGVPVARLAPDGKLWIEAREARVADIIQQIATIGKLQVLVDSGATRSLSFLGLSSSPEQVLRMVSQRAGLEVRKRGEVFLVRQPRAEAPEPVARVGDETFSLLFEDGAVRDLADTLAVASGVVVEVEGDLSHTKIPLVRLEDVTFKAALEDIALLLDARLDWKEGRYVLSRELK